MTDQPLIWRRLHLTPPLDPYQAVNSLRALVTLPHAPKVVLEAEGANNLVEWRLGVPPLVVGGLQGLLTTTLPGARLSVPRTPRPTVRLSANVRLHGNRQQQLRVDAMEEVSRSLLAALSSASGDARVRVQLILGGRLRPLPTSPKLAPEPRRALRDKQSEHGFVGVLRIGAHATSDAAARRLIERVVAALRGVESPGVEVRLRRVAPADVHECQTPWRWPLRLNVHEAACFTAWPLGKPPHAGVAAPHPRLSPVPDNVARIGRELGVAADDPSRIVAISAVDSLRHLHVLGPTGVGKSTLLAHLALSDLEARRGLVVIDPKGDLVADLLARIPTHRLDDVVVLDPSDLSPVGLNPLLGDNPDQAADVTLDVLHSLYQDAWGPRTQDILHASLLTLARRGDASLLMVPLLLTHSGFRRSIVARQAALDPVGLGAFWAWFDSISDSERQTAIAPLMNKLRPILLRPGLRGVFGQRTPAFALSDVFTRRRVLLVSLAKGQLGPDGSRLLGSLVVGLLWQAALARATMPAAQRQPVMVVIDEVQDYLRLPGDLGDALATARGLGVSFTLAHQLLTQLPPSLRAGISANARSRVAFQLPHEDAVVMSRGSDLAPEDFTWLSAYSAYASVSVDGDPGRWASIRTLPLPAKSGDPAHARALSRSRYGRPLSEVEADWAQLTVPDPTNDRIGRTPRGERS